MFQGENRRPGLGLAHSSESQSNSGTHYSRLDDAGSGGIKMYHNPMI
jgi:hypothetical protein